MKAKKSLHNKGIQLVDAETLADRYGFQPKTIRKYAREGVFPVVKLSRRAHRFNVADCDAIIERMTVRAIEEV